MQHETPRLTLGAQGSWTVFESGNPILQAAAAASWLSEPRSHLALELGGVTGVSRYASEPATGHLLARLRGHVVGERAGAWLGATAGSSFGDASETPVELAFGAWGASGQFTFVGGLSSTSVGNRRFVDATATARWSNARLELEARASARPSVTNSSAEEFATTGVWAEGSLLVHVASRVTFAISGGNYASDPVRRILGATYASAGIRLALAGSERQQPLALPAPLMKALREHASATTSASARVEIVASGEHYVLRVFAAAKSVEVMADFTDWQPAQLKGAGDNIWEAPFILTAGVHRLNIRIDGGEWLVPAGARSEEGEFGGAVGVIVVR